MELNPIVILCLFSIFSYLAGSLNGAQLIHHFLRGKYPLHVSDVGTKNLGAQNVFMNVGKTAGLIVFGIDFLKGFAVVSLGRVLGFEGAILVIFAALSIAGHNWPVFFHFRGGRGFAALIGSFYGFDLAIGAMASLISIPFAIARVAGITPFVFLLVGSLFFYSTFGLRIVLAYIFTSIILYAKRVHAEWDSLSKADNKITILKNLLIYDRPGANPPSLRDLFF